MVAGGGAVNPTELGPWLDAHEVTTVRTEGVTPDGVVLGKHLSRSKFERSLPLGPAISDIAFGYDIGGTPYFGWWGDWRQECLGDIHQRPDLATLVVGVDRPGMASCIVDYVDVAGEPLPVCARSVLRRVVERLAVSGLTARAAFELEGMVFTESYAEARGKGYGPLTPMGLPAPVGYLLHDARLMTRFMDEVVRRLDGLGIPWEAWSAEAAPGQFEINLEPADPVAAADQTMRLKQVVKEVAVDLGHSATFMAKPSDAYGNGMHIHHSVSGSGAGAAFYDEAAPDHRSQLMRHWIGGLMATMPGATSILTPTINSYRRMVGFAAAPTVISWAEENKSVALRVISRSAKLARVEHRVGAADLNSYLALAAILAGGIAGVEGAIEPPAETMVIAWGLPDRFPHLPASITAAANALEHDKRLADILGADMVDHWVQTRRWEWLMFHTTGGDPDPAAVSEWELRRYFELV
jgi:glutamine synthetase